MPLSRRDLLGHAVAMIALPAVPRVPIEVLLTPRGETTLDITRIGSQPSGKGPSDWFTGTVRIDPLFQPHPPARAAGASVTFEPGARTAWHTHPLGQTLIVTSGSGLVQSEGGPIEAVHPGDVVWFPPGVKHWHGASPTAAMTHIAIQEGLDGKVVDWLEHVTDEQYRRCPPRPRTGPDGSHRDDPPSPPGADGRTRPVPLDRPLIVAPRRSPHPGLGHRRLPRVGLGGTWR